VTAVPDAGYRFDRWSGDDGYSSTANPLTLTSVTASTTVTANFSLTAPHAISGLVTEGTAPLAEVTVSFAGGISPVTTDAAGRYSQKVPENWSGTVTPSKPGYVFTPETRTVAGVTGDLPGQDFVAIRAAPGKRYLRIHYINVQQGQSIFIEGPDGSTVLYDGGNTGKGMGRVIPYLQKLGYRSKIDHIIISHRDSDHYKGIAEVLASGYTCDHIYDNGSSKAYGDDRLSGIPITPLSPGFEIYLGDDSRIRCVTANGYVLGYGLCPGAQDEENDRSVGLLLQYGKFDYLATGDLGGGDESCTGHSTSQVDVESKLVEAIMPGGSYPLLGQYGVEVMHVAHHGSESSTNSTFMNRLTPRVAVISAGAGQSSSQAHPRQDVVENVLLAQSACVTAPAALVLQTEEGEPIGSETSTAGHCVGDLVITTDGETSYRIEADGNVSQGPDERNGARLPLTLEFDEP